MTLSRRDFLGTLGATLALGGASLLGADAWAPRSPSKSRATHQPQLGQWLWTRRDVAPFESLQRRWPGAVAAVCIGEVMVEEGMKVRCHRRLSPRVVSDAPVEVVIRLHDSVHQLLSARTVSECAGLLSSAISPILTEVYGEVRKPRALQLDYDAPVAHLSSYARVLGRLRERLPDGALWLTSIPAHLEEPKYGSLFESVCDGHILQLFDTGLACSPSNLQALLGRLARHQLPFRVGLGTFERQTPKGLTEHGAWRHAASLTIPRLDQYQGAYVFAAGKAYRGLDQLVERMTG